MNTGRSGWKGLWVGGLLAVLLHAVAVPVRAGDGPVLGSAQVDTFFGEPLRAEVPLQLPSGTTAAEVEATLAGYERFRAAGLDRDLITVPLHVTVHELGKNGARIVIASRESLREPALGIVLEVRIADAISHHVVDVVLGGRPREGAAPRARTDARTAERTAPAPLEPVRVGRAPTAPAPASPTRYGPTRRGDTLYRIAAEVRPDPGIPVPAMAMALFEANPHAFFEGNINNLKRGVVLEVPTSAADAAEAGRAFERHMRKWVRPAPAAAADDAPSAEGAGATTAPVPAAAAAPAGVARAGAGPVPVDDVLSERIADQRIARARLSEQQAALRERMARLDENIAAIRRSLERHSMQMGALKAEVGRLVGTVAADASAPAPAEPSPSLPAEPAAAEPVPPAAAEASAPARATPAVPPAAADPGTGTRPTSEPVTAIKKPVPLPPPGVTRTEPGSASDLAATAFRALTDPFGGKVAAILLAILAAGLAAWMIARRLAGSAKRVLDDRRHEQREAGLRSHVSEKAARAADERRVAASTAATTAIEPAVSRPAAGEPEPDEDAGWIDPELAVAAVDDAMQSLFREVDVFVAYGRFHDAVERLERAMEASPDQYVLRAKLGEVLFESGDVPGFTELARGLYLRLQQGGDTRLWARMALLGQRLAPGERLFEQTLDASPGPSPDDDYIGLDELAERRARL